MDSERFDRIVRSFGQTRSRRQALRTLAGVAAGAVALGGAAAVDAGRCKNGKFLCGKGKNACVDRQTDVNNCGSCGWRCESGQVCQNGGCASVSTGHCENLICPPYIEIYNLVCLDAPHADQCCWSLANTGGITTQAQCVAVDSCASGGSCYRWVS
jgi:hypothetical protein